MQIANNIYWTGYIDWGLRNFHGYSTPSGSTYNAYLIVDEYPTIIDTVKHYGFAQMLFEIKDIIDPSRIRYIVSNHSEMDHSGSIDKLIEFSPNAEVICSPQGKENLRYHFKKNWKFKVVDTQDTLNIGKRTLKFFLTPMVHWPDSMVTYSETDGILFSNDAFGQHYASVERFVDEAGRDIVLRESAKYYANIVMPYGNNVLKTLETLNSLKIEMICPSHGLIWRKKEDIEKIKELYLKWGSYRTDKKVVIVYDTMWGSTERIAFELFKLIGKLNIPCRLINLAVTHISEVITEVLEAKVLILGTPILNNKIFPTVASFLTYLRGLKPKNRFGLTFGSYGWSKLGFKELEDGIKEAGIELIAEGIYPRYVPDDDFLNDISKVVIKIKELLDKEEIL
ncbi:MAG: FprA family A-type flavoprotein [Candidatus Omnitrophica bacterium]|nr:FprA family A-type flavoprotein [Candidatus Omnitrophota bacterium]